MKNELRLNNWVQYQSSQGMTPIKVADMNSEGIELFVHDYHPHNIRCDLMYEDLTGIPLTPELLEKCGFVNNGELFDNNKWTIRFHRQGCAVYYDDRWLRDMQHLHTLQNLFYFVTNTELTITL